MLLYFITCFLIILPVSLSAQTYAIPGQIEAENYSSMSGIQTEACSEGGTNVGWIEAGDWMEYSVNITAGTYNVSYRVASLSSGGGLSLQINGATYNTVSFAATGGWQTWTTVTGTATLPGGNQTIRIYANQTGWNINWFSFASTGVSTPTPTPTPGSSLTDITNLGGTVSAQYYDSPTNEEIDKLVDNTTSTKYLTFHTSGWVQYQISTGYVVTRYDISSANDAAERDPYTWTFQGSNNGSTWTTLDTRSGEDFPNRFQTRSFSFSNSSSFTYYRLNMTNNSGSILQLSELAIYGVPGSNTNTATPTTPQQNTATPTPTQPATLTDITNLGGTVSAQYYDSPTNEEIDKLIDNTTSTKYLTFHASGWVQYQIGTGYVVTRYDISSANDAAERDPYTWTFQGSNNGSTWATLDSRSGEDFPNRFQTRSFSFSNVSSYTYYRLNMTNNSGTILQLSEWAIYGVQGSNTNTATPTTPQQNTATPTRTSTPTPTWTPAPTATPVGGWRVVWEDNFDVDGQPNSANWNYHVGNGYNTGIPDFQGWGNGEWEWYRPENSYVQGGNLVLRADYSTTPYYNVGGRDWYQKSGRVTTQGKHSWTYGKIEARIRLPKGQGNWCAFWMLGASSDGSYTSNYNPSSSYYDVMVTNWASCGEVDICEHVAASTTGFANCFWDNRIGVYPWDGTQNANYGNDAAYYGDVNVYKVYSLEWDATYMKWLVDGVQTHIIDITPSHLEEFHKPFYLILNMAIGGTLGGAVDAGAFPMYMYVDYVRVSQK